MASHLCAAGGPASDKGQKTVSPVLIEIATDQALWIPAFEFVNLSPLEVWVAFRALPTPSTVACSSESNPG